MAGELLGLGYPEPAAQSDSPYRLSAAAPATQAARPVIMGIGKLFNRGLGWAQEKSDDADREEREKYCDWLYDKDAQRCTDRVSEDDPELRSLCYQSAMARLVACKNDADYIPDLKDEW